jgi:hypothetical protein
LKPELWLSEDIRRLSAAGRLAFIYLITQADDEGRVKYSVEHLTRIAVNPQAEVVEISVVDAQLNLMVELGMIARYSAGGMDFAALLGWERHQKISHPTPSAYPAPAPNLLRRLRNPLRKVRVAATDSSEDLLSKMNTNGATDPARVPRERAGWDGSLTSSSPGGGLKEGAEGEPSRPGSRVDPVMVVYLAWRDTHKTARRLSEGGRAAIRARLKDGYPLQDVVDAAIGWVWDDWPRRRENNRLEDCLRPSNIEKFRDWTRGVNRPGLMESLPLKIREGEAYGAALRQEAARLREQGD